MLFILILLVNNHFCNYLLLLLVLYGINGLMLYTGNKFEVGYQTRYI